MLLSCKKKISTLLFIVFIMSFIQSAQAYENPWVKRSQQEDTIGKNTQKSIGAIVTMFMDKTTSFCYKNSYGRGIGKLASKCPPGYIRKGIAGAFMCYKECRAGYNLDDFGWCRKPNCPSGYSHLSGFICSKNSSPSTTCLRKSYMNTDMKHLECETDDEEYQIGLCYPKCKVGMKGIGPVCWLNCSTTMLPTDCASTCAKDTATCAIKTFQMVSAPLEIVANVAMLVFTGGTANAAINQAKTAAKTAAQVAAKTLAKQLLKNFAKNALIKIVPQALSAVVNHACNLAMQKTTSANAQEQWGDTTCQAAGAAAGAIGAAVVGKFSAKSFSKIAGQTALKVGAAVAQVGIERASQEACSRISDKRGSAVCAAGFTALAALTDVAADPEVKSHNIKTALRNFARKDLLHIGLQLGVSMATAEVCNAALSKNIDKLPGACDQVAAAVGGMTALGLVYFDDEAEVDLPEEQEKPNTDKPPKLKLIPPEPELDAPESIEDIREKQSLTSTSLKDINGLAVTAFSLWPSQGMAGESILPTSNGVLTSVELNECRKSKNLKSPMCVLIGLIAKANVFTPMANYFSQDFSDKVTLGSAFVGLTDEYVPFYVSLGLTAPEVYDCIDKATKSPTNVPKHCLLAAAISQTKAAYTKIQEIVATTGFQNNGGVEPKNVDDSGSGVSLSMLEALACTKILENSNIDLGSQAAHAKYCKNLFIETAKKSGGKSIDEILSKSMALSDKDAARISIQRAQSAEIETYRTQLATATDFKNLFNMLKSFFSSAKVEQPELHADYLIDAVAIALANQIVNQDRKKSPLIEGLCDTPKECAYLIGGMIDPVGVVGLVEAYDHSICNGLNKTELGNKNSYPSINSLRAFANYKSKLAAKQAVIDKCGANPNDPACTPTLQITNSPQSWVGTLAADKKRASFNLRITEPDTLDEWYWKLENGQPTLYVFAFEDQKDMRYDEREAMGALLVPLPTDACTTEIINKSTGDVLVTKASQGIIGDWLASQDISIIQAVANGTQLASLGALPKVIKDADKCLAKEAASNYKEVLKKIANDIINPPPADPVPEIMTPPALPVKGAAAKPATTAAASTVAAKPATTAAASTAAAKPATTAAAPAAQAVDKVYATFKDYCKDGNNVNPRSFCCLGFSKDIGCPALAANDVKHLDMCKGVIAQTNNTISECCKTANYLSMCQIYKKCAALTSKKRSEFDAQYCKEVPKSK